jgi:hypothetical protein
MWEVQQWSNPFYLVMHIYCIMFTDTHQDLGCELKRGLFIFACMYVQQMCS